MNSIVSKGKSGCKKVNKVDIERERERARGQATRFPGWIGRGARVETFGDGVARCLRRRPTGRSLDMVVDRGSMTHVLPSEYLRACGLHSGPPS